MKHKAKHYFIGFLKYSFFWCCLFFLYKHILNFEVDLKFIKNEVFNKQIYVLFFVFSLVLLLSALNWSCEFIKWKKLISSFTTSSLKEAMQVSLIGHCISTITPAKSGDFLAKFYWYKNWKEILPLNLIHQYTQLFTTLLFGLGFLFLHPHFKELIEQISFFSHTTWLLLTVVCLILILSFMLKYKNVIKIMKIRFLRNNFSLIFEAQSLSIFKYLSFSFQYLLLLYFFSNEFQLITVYGGITVVYLLSSILPVNQLVDIGVKTSWGIFILTGLGIDPGTIFFTTFLMWVLNFAIPALIGGWLILRLQIEITETSSYLHD